MKFGRQSINPFCCILYYTRLPLIFLFSLHTNSTQVTNKIQHFPRSQNLLHCTHFTLLAFPFHSNVFFSRKHLFLLMGSRLEAFIVEIYKELSCKDCQQDQIASKECSTIFLSLEKTKRLYNHKKHKPICAKVESKVPKFEQPITDRLGWCKSFSIKDRFVLLTSRFKCHLADLLEGSIRLSQCFEYGKNANKYVSVFFNDQLCNLMR